MRRGYSRDDVELHSGGFGTLIAPAVNVKIYRSPLDDSVWDEFVRSDGPDEGFTREWIEENISEEQLDRIFWDCCVSEFEYLEGWATGSDRGDDALFPDHNVKLWQEGRSGGWVVVDGLPDLEDWDAVMLARWRKFERIAKDIARGVPAQCLSLIYINDYEWAVAEAAERERAANQEVATV